MITLPAQYLAAAAAALMVGFSKTGVPGAAIPAVALMAEAFPDQTRLSVGALLPLLLLGDVFAIVYYRRHAQWSHLIRLCPFVVAGMLPGFWVLWQTTSSRLRLLLGVLILVLLALHLLSRRVLTGSLAQRRWFVAATGLLAGFGTAVGNAAGPAMTIYLVSSGLSKRQFLGTAAWFFMIVNLTKLPMFVAMGIIPIKTVQLDAWIAPALVVGALTGVAALRRIPQKVFDVLVLSLAALAALRLITS